MDFSKTNNLSDVFKDAVEIIIGIGYYFPSDAYFDELFNRVRSIQIRDILDEILSSGITEQVYQLYKDRLNVIFLFDRNLKDDTITFNGRSFNFSEVCRKHYDAAAKHYKNKDGADMYFGSVYTLANMMQVIKEDVNETLDYIDKTLFPRQPERKYSSSLMNLFYNDCKVIDIFIKRTANVKGIKIVNEIIALRELKKIKPSNKVSNKLLREILSEVANVTAQSAFDSAFCLGDGNTQMKRRKAINEAKELYSKL